MKFDIRQADEGDNQSLHSFYQSIGKEDVGYFENVLGKDCLILIAEVNEVIVGFGIINFEPKYNYYQKFDIPEVQDINVHSDFRENGIATEIIYHLENIARDQGNEKIGISVGLTKEYGPAQRLYFKLGYSPDGFGMTQDRQYVSQGQSVSVDDDLCLMLVKDL